MTCWCDFPRVQDLNQAVLVLTGERKSLWKCRQKSYLSPSASAAALETLWLLLLLTLHCNWNKSNSNGVATAKTQPKQMYHILCVNTRSRETKQDRKSSDAFLKKMPMRWKVWVYEQHDTAYLMPQGKWRSWIMKDGGRAILCTCCFFFFMFLYLWVEADLADVTGDDWPLGLDQWNSKGVVDHGLLHRIHLTEKITGKRQTEGEQSVSYNSYSVTTTTTTVLCSRSPGATSRQASPS